MKFPEIYFLDCETQFYKEQMKKKGLDNPLSNDAYARKSFIEMVI